MHALSHSLAHRAPPATRPRIRWQPYCAVSSSVSSRSSPVSCLHTPASSVTSSPQSSALSVCEIERPRLSLPPFPPKEYQPRDHQKIKYAIGLVDQAVKSLCEIWNPQDVPSVFLTSSRVQVVIPMTPEPPSSLIAKTSHLHYRNTQLPSPVTPSTHQSPPSPSHSPPTDSISSNQNNALNANARNNLIPLRGFVHEVLRRSRTSGSVLQTALCYLEAIRLKVPELVQRQRAGDEEDTGASNRIIQGDIEMSEETKFAETVYTSPTTDQTEGASIATQPSPLPPPPPPTTTTSSIRDPKRKPKSPSPPLEPLPPLPSPLLCPRRAFLASLILASKFTQDKCYSNRAWAKLSGLPPREIGRCERALGDALEWRLWVGKVPTASAVSTAQMSPPHGRAVVRCQSDGDLLMSGAKSGRLTSDSGQFLGQHTTANTGRTLRRSVTFPAFGPHIDHASRTTAIKFTDPFGEPAVSPASIPNIPPETGPMPVILASTTAYSEKSQRPSYPDKVMLSPRLATPTLTYSPSSTDSSGDRTIQMTSFIDEPIPVPPIGRSSCNARNHLGNFFSASKASFNAEHGIDIGFAIRSDSATAYAPFESSVGYGHVGLGPDMYYHHRHQHATYVMEPGGF